jgi:hypothetical protein
MYDAVEPLLRLDCHNQLGECPLWDSREGGSGEPTFTPGKSGAGIRSRTRGRSS